MRQWFARAAGGPRPRPSSSVLLHHLAAYGQGVWTDHFPSPSTDQDVYVEGPSPGAGTAAALVLDCELHMAIRSMVKM